MKSGVIFDMDGIIIDSEPLQKMAFDEVMAEYGLTLSEEKFLTLVGKRSIDNFQNLINEYNISATAKHLEQEKTKHYNKILKERLHPIDGIIDVLNFLLSKNVSMALVSGSIKNDVDIVIKGLNLNHFFSHILTGEDVKQGKPHPEGFLRAAEEIKIEPSVSYVVEDSSPGVQSAFAGSFIPLAVPTYFTKNQDFSKAKFIFKNAHELLDFFKKTFS